LQIFKKGINLQLLPVARIGTMAAEERMSVPNETGMNDDPIVYHAKDDYRS
jgi:hypothetical protein